MTTVELPIEELRRQIAQTLVQPQGTVSANAVYRELIGFAPPCPDACDAMALESALRDMHEQVRIRQLAPSSIDAKAVQLIWLAMVLKEHGAAAVSQGVAARRAGASWEELRGVVRLVFFMYGIPGSNRGDEFLAALAEREREDRVAGAVAAYG